MGSDTPKTKAILNSTIEYIRDAEKAGKEAIKKHKLVSNDLILGKCLAQLQSISCLLYHDISR